MITLRQNKVLQNLIGFGEYVGKNQSLDKFWIVCESTLMLSSFVTCLINIFFFFSNVKVVTELMFCCVIYVIIIGSYWTVLMQWKYVRQIIVDIQETVDESKFENFIEMK